MAGTRTGKAARQHTLVLIRQLAAEARQLFGNQILPEQEQLSEPAGPGGNTITPQSSRRLRVQSQQPFSNQ